MIGYGVAPMRRRSIIILAAIVPASCSSGDGTSSATTVETSESTPETTTTSVASTTSTTSTSTSTTVDPTWDREAELAVRQCLDEAKGADLWIPFMYEFDEPTDVEGIQDACDAAVIQLELEDGLAAAEVATAIGYINLKLAFEMVNWTGGAVTPSEPVFDYRAAATDAEALIP